MPLGCCSSKKGAIIRSTGHGLETGSIALPSRHRDGSRDMRNAAEVASSRRDARQEAWRRGLVLAVVVLYTLAVVVGAYQASPTRTEPAHLAAGISHWRFGDFSLYHVNPPMVRLVASLPVLAANAAVDWSQYKRDPTARSEFWVGRTFVRANGERSVWLVFLARMACLPLALLGAWVCFRWARELHGEWAGLTALALWCSCPLVLGHGSLMTPDVPAAALGVWACYLFWRWAHAPSWPRALGAGAALGAAELSKYTWLVLFGLWPALYLLARRAANFRGQAATEAAVAGLPTVRPRLAGALQLASVLLFAVYLINVCYAFEGSFQPLGQFQFTSRALQPNTVVTSDDETSRGNRFGGTWLGGLPVPLPMNYLAGVDTQRRDFEVCRATFFRGEWREHAPGWAYLYALGVKLPLGTLALVGLGVALTIARREYNAGAFDELCLLAPVMAITAVAWFYTGRHTNARYMLPVLPLLFVWASKAARSVALGHWTVSSLAAGALLWSVASSLWYWPHSLAYFNELAGGPAGGASLLTESNVDWGQDLSRLKAWLDRHPEARPLRAALAAGYDPRDIGLDYQPIDTGASAGRPFQPPPGWYAISAYELCGPTDELAAFRKLTPTEVVGYSIYIYHVASDDDDDASEESSPASAEGRS